MLLDSTSKSGIKFLPSSFPLLLFFFFLLEYPNHQFGYSNYSFGYPNHSFGYSNYSFGYSNYSFGYSNYSFGYSNCSFGYSNYPFGYSNWTLHCLLPPYLAGFNQHSHSTPLHIPPSELEFLGFNDYRILKTPQSFHPIIIKS